jgi:hypothetical protein
VWEATQPATSSGTPTAAEPRASRRATRHAKAGAGRSGEGETSPRHRFDPERSDLADVAISRAKRPSLESMRAHPQRCSDPAIRSRGPARPGEQRAPPLTFRRVRSRSELLRLQAEP